MHISEHQLRVVYQHDVRRCAEPTGRAGKAVCDELGRQAHPRRGRYLHDFGPRVASLLSGDGISELHALQRADFGHNNRALTPTREN